jgi:ADP-ribose pyrophosphatase
MSYQTVKSTSQFVGRRCKVLIDEVKAPGDFTKNHFYEVVDVKNGVAAVVVNSQTNKIVLNENHRYPVKETFLELIAGLIDEGELPEKAVVREIEEESGMIAELVNHVGDYYTSPGLLTEKISIFVVVAKPGGKQSLDDMEKGLKQREFTPAEIAEMLGNGQIKDLKTAYALSVFLRFNLKVNDGD